VLQCFSLQDRSGPQTWSVWCQKVTSFLPSIHSGRHVPPSCTNAEACFPSWPNAQPEGKGVFFSHKFFFKIYRLNICFTHVAEDLSAADWTKHFFWYHWNERLCICREIHCGVPEWLRLIPMLFLTFTQGMRIIATTTMLIFNPLLLSGGFTQWEHFLMNNEAYANYCKLCHLFVCRRRTVAGHLQAMQWVSEMFLTPWKTIPREIYASGGACSWCP